MPTTSKRLDKPKTFFYDDISEQLYSLANELFSAHVELNILEREVLINKALSKANHSTKSNEYAALYFEKSHLKSTIQENIETIEKQLTTTYQTAHMHLLNKLGPNLGKILSNTLKKDIEDIHREYTRSTPPAKEKDFTAYAMKHNITNNLMIIFTGNIMTEASMQPKKTATDQSEMKVELIKGLKDYINRINAHDFNHEFTFFIASQALNREANYLLAEHLIEQLEKPEVRIENIFSDLANVRTNLISQHEVSKMDDADFLFYGDKYKKDMFNMLNGINSRDLNSVINKAKRSTR